MPNFLVFIANFVAFLFLSAIDSASATVDNVFEDVADAADAYHSSRNEKYSGPVESTGVRGDIDIANGIYRGEASSYSNERDDQSSGATRSSGTTRVKMDTVDSSDGHASCAEDTDYIIALNADIRLELSAIDTIYLEHASIEDACNHDGKYSNCNLDFRLFPNNLNDVCEHHGDSFYETEHSIQCHNPSTKESLYYQFDHYPSCFSPACDQIDVKHLVGMRIDSITQTMSEYLEMTCFADDAILRHASYASAIESSTESSTESSIESSIESSGIKKSWHVIQMLPAATFLLLLLK